MKNRIHCSRIIMVAMRPIRVNNRQWLIVTVNAFKIKSLSSLASAHFRLSYANMSDRILTLDRHFPKFRNLYFCRKFLGFINLSSNGRV